MTALKTLTSFFVSFLISFFVLLLPLGLAATQSIADTPETRWVSDWREDIDTLQRELEARHINLYHTVSAEEFSGQLAQIKSWLTELSQTQLIVELMRITKLIGDGHTQLNYWGGAHSHYPLQLRMFDDDIRVVATDQSHKNLLGMRLHSIEGTPIVSITDALKPVLLGVENRYSEQHQLATTLTVAEVLQGLGVTASDTTEFIFADDKNQLHPLLMRSLPAEKLRTVLTESITPPLPLRFVRHRSSLEGLELYLDGMGQTAYFDFDHYPSSSQMQSFAQGLRKTLTDNDIKRVIIDFRQNGGGDFFVGLTLAWGLIVIDGLDWEEGFYVLTSGQTFSAAMSNAAQYRQLLNATLVGEPTGANPVGYQDADTFVLPNSNWKVMYSKRYYRFQDAPSEGVQPDVLLAPDWKKYRAGRDNQLEWILDKIASEDQDIK